MFKLNNHDYNTVKGIEKYLKNYASFHAILHARKEAHVRGEALDSFVVLGAFTLDTFGQLGKLEPTAKSVFPDIPSVVTLDDFREYTKDKDAQFSNVLSPVYLPPLYVKCAECGKYYGTNDCHDVITSTEEQTLFPLSDFVGKQFWEVRRVLQKNHDAEYAIHPSVLIRNDRFIDERVKPYSNSSFSMNERGWVGMEDGLTDWYVIQPGDETSFSIIKYFHHECFKFWINEKTEAKFDEILKAAGLSTFMIEVVENKYGSFAYRGPWLEVNTPFGNFTIGWRKRVIQITLHDWPIDCRTLFANEDVTKERQLIHSWSHEKATEYLRVMLDAVIKAKTS